PASGPRGTPWSPFRLLCQFCDVCDGLLWTNGRSADVIEDEAVLLQFVALLEEEPTRGVLRVHDIRITGLGKTEDREGPVHAGVRTHLEREDLERHVRQLGHLDQPPELAAHHLVPAHRPTYHRLIEHHPQIDRIVLRQQRLTAQSDTHPLMYLIGGEVRTG